jgi:hypothetical protein
VIRVAAGTERRRDAERENVFSFRRLATSLDLLVATVPPVPVIVERLLLPDDAETGVACLSGDRALAKLRQSAGAGLVPSY